MRFSGAKQILILPSGLKQNLFYVLTPRARNSEIPGEDAPGISMCVRGFVFMEKSLVVGLVGVSFSFLSSVDLFY